MGKAVRTYTRNMTTYNVAETIVVDTMYSDMKCLQAKAKVCVA